MGISCKVTLNGSLNKVHSNHNSDIFVGLSMSDSSTMQKHHEFFSSLGRYALNQYEYNENAACRILPLISAFLQGYGSAD